MNIEVIRDPAPFYALKKEWEELRRASLEEHPFATHDWMTTWWDRMPRKERFWLRHELHILVAREEGIVIAVLPLFKTIFASWFFGGIGFLHPLGSDGNITEIKPLLARRGRELAAIEAFDRYLQDKARSWHFCQWPDLPAAFAGGITANKRRAPPLECFVVPLSPTWESFRGSRKTNVKEAIRKCLNAPARAGINLTFENLKEPVAIRAALPDFYRLHSLRAATQNTNDHPDYFQVPGNRQFLEALVGDTTDMSVRLFLLRHDGAVVAARLGFAVGKTIYLYYSGFDTAYSAYSAPTRLVVEVIQAGIAEGMENLHLSTGRDVSKVRWSPVEVSYLRPFVARQKLIAKTMLAVFFGLGALRRRISSYKLSKATGPTNELLAKGTSTPIA